MGGGSTVIHCNHGLSHQVEIAQCLAAGVPGAVISYLPDTPAEMHITMGPWFAPQWKENTLYIDRAYWGDPDCVSVHWLIGGEKARFAGKPHRPHPELQPMKTGDRTIYLADYGEKWGSILPEKPMTIRYHPAQSTPERTLEEDLAAHDVAIGGRSTAMVEALIRGLRVETKDPHSPVYGVTDRHQWIHDLAWHNWSKDEIRRGEMWEALRF